MPRGWSKEAAPANMKKSAMDIDSAIDQIGLGRSLDRAEAEALMEELLAGRLAEEQIVRLLAALREKGESVEELVGFAGALRRRAQSLFDESTALDGAALVDTCGTGGDAKGTFNISTAAAFVAAGAGARVAKHGNRSYTSRCGSADVLEALGVNVSMPPARTAEAIRVVGIGFFFAPVAHSAAKHAASARKKVGGRTVFNLLGPLSNPAGAAAQVLGVFDARWVEPMARALAQLGTRRAFVVYGADGLDEISLSGETHMAEVRGAEVRLSNATPEEFGLQRAALEHLTGGDAAENATIIRRIFAGEHGPRRDIVLMNAAAALVAADLAADLRAGAELAARAIDSGAAAVKLEALVRFLAT